MNGEKQKRERLFLTQLREKENQYGTYMIGSLQGCDVVVQRSAKPGQEKTWNVFLLQADFDRKNKPTPQSAGDAPPAGNAGWGTGEIPF